MKIATRSLESITAFISGKEEAFQLLTWKKFAIEEYFEDQGPIYKLGVEELETDCILNAQDEQGRRIRKAMASAFL